MDTRPEWVPEWVWDAFERYRASGTDNQGYPFTDTEREHIGFCNRVVESTLRDKQCQTVWKAIDLRRGEPERRFRSWCREHGICGSVPFDDAERLLGHIGDAASGVPRAECIPVSERRAIATNIATHATALLRELTTLAQRCGNEDGSYPLVSYSGTASSLVIQEVINANAEVPGMRDDWRDERFVSGFHFGVQCGTDALHHVLTALVSDANTWKASPPIITRPKDANATRLYFIRDMTAYFRNSYGTPLREPVAALTRSIYQCEMDAATVAKLAP